MDMIDEAAYVYFLSIFKFIFGPVLGLSYGFGVIWTAALTTLGTLTAAIVFSFFGPQIRAFFSLFFKKKKQKKVFTKKNRRFVKIWNKYGVAGIAFFTPILLTPIGGTILANAFGGKKSEIIKYMLLWSAFWSVTLTYALKYFGDILKDYLPFLNNIFVI